MICSEFHKGATSSSTVLLNTPFFRLEVRQSVRVNIDALVEYDICTMKHRGGSSQAFGHFLVSYRQVIICRRFFEETCANNFSANELPTLRIEEYS
jgi:hypothetical protein